MSQYYYLTNSLPFLLPESEANMDSAAFLAACQGNMTEGDYRQLIRCRLIPGTEETGDKSSQGAGELHPLIRRWNAWEISLRNELVRIRAQKLKTDAESHIREGGDAGGLFEAAREVAGMANPLEAELRLDRIRWSFLDELESGHFFDLEKLLVYYLKLQILDRRASFSAKKGEEAYGRLYQKVVEQIKETGKTGSGVSQG